MTYFKILIQGKSHSSGQSERLFFLFVFFKAGFYPCLEIIIPGLQAKFIGRAAPEHKAISFFTAQPGKTNNQRLAEPVIYKFIPFFL